MHLCTFCHGGSRICQEGRTMASARIYNGVWQLSPRAGYNGRAHAGAE